MNVGEKITGHTCLGCEIIRKWIFSAISHDAESFYLDEFGNEIDYSDAIPFVGNGHDAALEAERRANLWEDGKNGLLAEIIYESQGIL